MTHRSTFCLTTNRHGGSTRQKGEIVLLVDELNWRHSRGNFVLVLVVFEIQGIVEQFDRVGTTEDVESNGACPMANTSFVVETILGNAVGKVEHFQP